MHLSLNGKVVFLTGASGVSGLSHILHFLDRGATVIASDRNEELVSHIYKKFSDHPSRSNLYLHVLDVTSESQIKNLFREIFDLSPNVFINNAAITGEMLANSGTYSSDLSNITLDTWKSALDVNLTSAFLISREIDRRYIKRYPIKLINISSIYGFFAPHHQLYADSEIKPFPAYSASKAGIHGLTLWLSSYWRSYGSTVNTLSPAGVFNNQPKELVDQLSLLNISNRMAKPSEVSAKLCFLSSPDSDFMTGQNIFVDGGFSAW